MTHFSQEFADHASPQAIRAELRRARVGMHLAARRVHALECLLERREMEIGDGAWPVSDGEIAVEVANYRSRVDAFAEGRHPEGRTAPPRESTSTPTSATTPTSRSSTPTCTPGQKRTPATAKRFASATERTKRMSEENNMQDLDMIEAKRGQANFASLVRSFYSSLIQEGFTPSEALHLTNTWVGSMTTPSA